MVSAVPCVPSAERKARRAHVDVEAGVARRQPRNATARWLRATPLDGIDVKRSPPAERGRCAGLLNLGEVCLDGFLGLIGRAGAFGTRCWPRTRDAELGRLAGGSR